MGSGYSPVVRDGAGRVTVSLADDHPGVTDAAYRARRDALAGLAAAWQPGQPPPEPVYTEAEHTVWRTVSAELAPRHRSHATRRFRRSAAALAVPADHVPQLREVSAGLQRESGFTYVPVAGLAPLRRFYGDLADGLFWSTQYLRHPSAPLYTPEPDIVHEVLGHANQLADPEVAAVYRLVGQAVRRSEGDEALVALSRIFWFTIEFGVVVEDGHDKAFGAGILSSVAELDTFQGARLVPANLAAMVSTDYDITRFQPLLYRFRSELHLLDTLAEILDSWDDDMAARLGQTVTAP